MPSRDQRMLVSSVLAGTCEAPFLPEREGGKWVTFSSRRLAPDGGGELLGDIRRQRLAQNVAAVELLPNAV